ncbi:hypothetical protein [Chloroflexus sp.]|uniref:hypothetical protein n=1 Tax=Chloroflexus sp. TaxID=1904827 RepID=UPI00404AA7D5
MVLILVFVGYDLYIGELQGKMLADGHIPPIEQMALVQFIDESGLLICSPF